MNPGPTFDRVYTEVRRRLLTGGWLPGQRIDLALLADGLGASITPVRDALHRLVGERLLTLGVSDGFAVPGLTEPELRDRYAWNHMLLTLALRSGQKVIGALAGATDDATSDLIVHLFRHIAERAQNIELGAAIESANDQLAYARLVEARLGIATESEADELVHIATAESPAMLRSSIARYHRRRTQMAGRIVYAMHRPA